MNGTFQERDLYTDLSSFSGKKYQVTRSTMDPIFQNSLHYYGTRLFNAVPYYLKANPEEDSMDNYGVIKQRLDLWVNSFLHSQAIGFRANNLLNRTRPYI